MRFTRVELKNWRNFRDVGVDLASRVFLIGPNASGKSNFLDLFKFLRDVVRTGGGFESAVQSRGGVSSLRSLHARGPSDVLLAVHVELDHVDWEYVLRFTQDNNRRAQIREEKIVVDGKILLCRPDSDDADDPERLRQTVLEQVNQNRDYRALVDFFLSVQYYHVVPQIIKDGGKNYHSNLIDDPYGSDFLKKVASATKKTRESRLRRIEKALKVIVPELSELVLERDSGGVPHLKAKFAHWRPQGGWQTEDQLSDGTLRFIGLVWALIDKKGPLLLEEPELSLHPAVVRRLPDLFARVMRQSKTRASQIIVSTHSTDMLNREGVDVSEVLVLRPSDSGVGISLASEFSDIVALLDAGEALGDAVIPITEPKGLAGLPLFDIAGEDD